jgi:LCP family protein required for cell wall assembly
MVVSMAREVLRKVLKRLALLLILIPLLAVSVACNLTGKLSFDPFPNSGPLVTANPFASATPTPFNPLSPTETPPPQAPYTATPLATPTSIHPWGNFASPVEPSAIEVPRPAPPINFSDSVVNLILLGSDQRPDIGGFRTDTMVILSLDPQAGKATMISIPRDLYVYIPGWRIDRINTADVRTGPEGLADTILYNFGINIDYWVRVNFSGFVTAIDLLGGVDVVIGGYLNDRCGDYTYQYAPGVVHMDGYTALCYVRMRKYSSDFDRLRRQQEVVQAIFNRVLSLDGLSRIPDLYAQFGHLVQTNMELDAILPLVPMGTRLASDPSQIQRFTIDAGMAQIWRVPYSGASVLLPNWEAIQEMLKSAFGP